MGSFLSPVCFDAIPQNRKGISMRLRMEMKSNLVCFRINFNNIGYNYNRDIYFCEGFYAR